MVSSKIYPFTSSSIKNAVIGERHHELIMRLTNIFINRINTPEVGDWMNLSADKFPLDSISKSQPRIRQSAFNQMDKINCQL